jgi:hypothetical protein
MLATPNPVTAPPINKVDCRDPPKPTVNNPAPTTTTAVSALTKVNGTSYRIVARGMLNPSIAMKCMTQIPVPPIDSAPRTSQEPREAPVAARALAVKSRPSSEPTHDMM